MSKSMFPEEERYLESLIDRISVDGVLSLIINVLEQRKERAMNRKQLSDSRFLLFETVIEILDKAELATKRAYNKYKREAVFYS